MKTFQFNKLVRDKIPAVNLTPTPGLKKELRYFKSKYLAPRS